MNKELKIICLNLNILCELITNFLYIGAVVENILSNCGNSFLYL